MWRILNVASPPKTEVAFFRISLEANRIKNISTWREKAKIPPKNED